MKNILFLIILAFSISCYSQENKLSFEFGYGINSYSMKNLNELYIDSFAVKPGTSLLHNHIKKGQQYRFTLSFKPNNHFDVGLYSSYQYGNLKSKPSIVITDDYGNSIGESRGKYELRTEAVSIGVISTWYISDLLKLQEKKSALNRLHFGIEANAGVAFSRVITDLQYCDYPNASFYNYFTSQDFQGQIGLKVEYDFTKQPIFTTLGLRFGYQFLKTKAVQDRMSKEWEIIEEHPISLDFSGLYCGVYLKIGK